MYKIYALTYVVIGIFLVMNELILIEDKAKKEKEFTVKIAYLLDWICLILLFPIVIIIRIYSKNGDFEKANFWGKAFHVLKYILVFIPKHILILIRSF